jgi:hypothetical protein
MKNPLHDYTDPSVWTDQVVTAYQRSIPVDTGKLIQYLRHFRDLNERLMNRLDRDPEWRVENKGRFDAYENILFTVTQTELLRPDEDDNREG